MRAEQYLIPYQDHRSFPATSLIDADAMRHQIRAMLNELAETGRLGMPTATDKADERSLKPHRARRPAAAPTRGMTKAASMANAASQPGT